MKGIISFLLLFVIAPTNGAKPGNELNVLPSDIINNLKNVLESDELVLFGGNEWMANTRKYAEWAHTIVCRNKSVLIGPLNKFVGLFCTGVVGKDWKNAKTNLIKAFGGQTVLIQTLTDNGRNILTKLKKDEESASEEHKASVSQAIRESLKQISAKMPAEINLETFYEHNKLGKLMQPSAIFGPIVQTLWPKMVELITAKLAKGISVDGHPKLLAPNKRKKRQMDTIILMLALLIGGFFVLGLTIYAFSFLIKFMLGPLIVVGSLVAIIWILLLQLF